VEPKASLHHPYEPLPLELAGRVEAGLLSVKEAEKQAQDEIRKAVTKTNAASLNSHGGTLHIGVGDLGSSWGLSRTFLTSISRSRTRTDGF
jgi:hypothetical protein